MAKPIPSYRANRSCNDIPLAIAETDGIRPIRTKSDGDGRIYLTASNGERRVIFTGHSNTVLANNGWPRRNKNAVLWIHAKEVSRG